MTRLFLLAALALLLPACDSGGSTDPNDLVGTWRTQSELNDQFVTVSETQTFRDSYAAGTGGVVLAGATAQTLRYAAIQTRGTSVVGGSLRATGNVDTATGEASIGFSAAGTPLLRLFAAGGVRTFVLASNPATAYTVTPTAIEFTSAVFNEAALGQTPVTANGRLTFVRRTLQAGQEGLATRSAPTADSGTASITFQADGTYQIVGVSGPRAGTWVADGNGQIQQTEAGRPPAAYDYRIDGSTLSLTQSRVLGADQFSSTEELFGLTAGTVTAGRFEFGTIYERAEAAGRPAGTAR